AILVSADGGVSSRGFDAKFPESDTCGQVGHERAHVSTDASANGTEMVDACFDIHAADGFVILHVRKLIVAFNAENDTVHGPVVTDLSAAQPAINILGEINAFDLGIGPAVADVGTSVEAIPDGRIVNDRNDGRGSRHDRISSKGLAGNGGKGEN